LDTWDQGGEVTSGDSRVSDQLDQVSDDDTSHSLGVGRSLFKSSSEKGDQDGEGRGVDLGNEGGGGQTLDGARDSVGGGHGGDKERDVFQNVRVGEGTAKNGGGLDGGSRDLVLAQHT